MSVGREPRLSLMLITFSADDPGGWEHVVRRAEDADAAGVDRLALADHVVFGERLDAYGDPRVGGSAGGRQPTGPDGHWLEPLSSIAYLAARTERIRLGTFASDQNLGVVPVTFTAPWLSTFGKELFEGTMKGHDHMDGWSKAVLSVLLKSLPLIVEIEHERGRIALGFADRIAPADDKS